MAGAAAAAATLQENYPAQCAPVCTSAFISILLAQEDDKRGVVSGAEHNKKKRGEKEGMKGSRPVSPRRTNGFPPPLVFFPLFPF